MRPSPPNPPVPPFPTGKPPQAALPVSEPPLSLPPGGPQPVVVAEPPPKPRRRSRFWLIAAILGVLVILVALFAVHRPPSAKGAGGRHGANNMPMPVVAVTATQGSIGVYDNGLGSVTPLNTVTVRARVDGQITKVYFTEGQAVKANDKLVEIDPRPYQAILDQFKGQLSRDQALLQNAKIDQGRYQTLWSQDSIPKQTLDTQVSLVAQDAAAVQTDQANVEAAQLNLDYCTVTAPIAGLVGLRLVDEGNLVHSSDTNGLLVITQIEPITVVFTVTEDQVPPILAQLRAGKKLAVDAYDREMKNKLATGSLLSLDNQIDTSTGTLKVKAIFDNKDGALFPNQFVNARLLVDTHTGVTLVPTAAIQRGPQNFYSYVVVPYDRSKDKSKANARKEVEPTDNFWNLWGLLGSAKADRSGFAKPTQGVAIRNITVGVTEGGLCEITDGLAPGDVVVIDGVDRLQEGSAVTVQMKQ